MIPPAHNDPDEPPWEWRPISPDDHIMTIDEFIEAVQEGHFIDYDGFGECATDTHVSNVRIYPSHLDRPSWTTNICWYNR